MCSLFFERFVLFFCLKIERFVPDSAAIWICGLYDIEYIFDVKQFNTEKLKPLEEKLYTIGYPAGAYRAVEKTNHSLEPDIRETMCSKVPGRYDFEFQGEAVGGASGSPIFNKHGELVGVLWGGWKMGSTLGLACQARYLKEMYEEEVGL